MSFASRPFDIFNTSTGAFKINDSDNRPFRKIEYLFEDATTEAYGPSWGARIMYGAGTTYTSCLAIGGLWGAVDGLRGYRDLLRGGSGGVGSGTTAAGAIKPSKRLLWNAIVNSTTARGPFLGNNIAMLAFMYNGIHGALLATLPDQLIASLNNASLQISPAFLAKKDFQPFFKSKDEEGKDITIINRHGNWISSVCSASLAGLIWKSSRGYQSALRTSGALAIGALLFNGVKNKI